MKEIKLRECEPKGFFEVIEEYKFLKYKIPKGFKTDTITVPKYIPKFIRDFIKREKARYIIASVRHDYLYSIKAGKFISDLIFYLSMLMNRTPFITATIFYLAVSIFGWKYYYSKRG